jgi:hypothetical protein
VLDWYEEGRFSPRFGGTDRDGNVFVDVATGDFQRIGDRVFFSLTVRVSQVVAAPAGGLVVRGLPYPAGASVAYRQPAHIGEIAGLAWPAGATQVAAGVQGAAIRIVGLQPGSGPQDFDSARLKHGDMIAISGHYRVDG